MQLSAALQQVRRTTAAIQPLNEEIWNDFAPIWKPFSARRKTVLTAAGETEKYLYFVTEGVQRAFTITDDNKDATLVFVYPYSFPGIIDSFLLQTPFRYY